MGRSPCCCHDAGVKKGPWTEDEDGTLVEHIQRRGGHVSSWRNLPRAAGLNRCGKSCRLRWTNYLRPDIRRGNFTDDEERLIIALHADLGNKWSTIATHLEGRTDNEIKNYWNTHIRKKLVRAGVDPVPHRRLPPDVGILNGALASPGGPPAGTLLCAAASSLRGQLDPALIRQAQALQLLLQVIGTCGSSNGSANALLGNCNLPTGNAMFTNNVNTSVAPNLQDQMMTIFSQANNQQSAGYSYPPNSTAAANFAEQGMVQQYLKSSAPSPRYGSPNGVPAAADQYCDTTATLERPANPQEVAAAGVDLPVPVPSFTHMLGPDDEMPNLYSLEEDGRFWDDMLHNSFSL